MFSWISHYLTEYGRSDKSGNSVVFYVSCVLFSFKHWRLVQHKVMYGLGTTWHASSWLKGCQSQTLDLASRATLRIHCMLVYSLHDRSFVHSWPQKWIVINYTVLCRQRILACYSGFASQSWRLQLLELISWRYSKAMLGCAGWCGTKV